MKIVSFFKLPLIYFVGVLGYFIVASEIDVGVIIIRIRDALFYTLIMSILLHYAKLYQLNLRNIILVLIITMLFCLFFTINELMTYTLLERLTGDQPLLERLTGDQLNLVFFLYSFVHFLFNIVMLILLTRFLIKILKTVFRLKDETAILSPDQSTINYLNSILFFGLFLLISFVYVDYLYVPMYRIFRTPIAYEQYNFCYFLSVIITALLILFITKNSSRLPTTIFSPKFVIASIFMIIVQLIIAFVISCLVMYFIEIRFYGNPVYGEVARYSNYIGYLYVLLKSIWVTAVIVALSAYFAGRIILAKYLLVPHSKNQ